MTADKGRTAMHGHEHDDHAGHGHVDRALGPTQEAIRGRAAHLGIMLSSAMPPWKISVPRGSRTVSRLKPAEMPKTEAENDA